MPVLAVTEKAMSAKRSCNLWLFVGALVLMLACAACDMPPAALPVTPTVGAPVDVQDLDIVSGQTIYVPAYGRIYHTRGGRTMDLTVTLTVHNADPTHDIILTMVRYHGADGRVVADYLPEPVRLGPLAATEFLVEAGTHDAGIGTNFLVEWVSDDPVYEPVIEAIMLNTDSNQGVSFTSPGRVVSQTGIREE